MTQLEKMRYYLITPVVGGSACNARCPFCVASMTPHNGVTTKAVVPDWSEYRRVCAFAQARGADEILYTSKGEPTLWPDLLTEYLRQAQQFGFARSVLQTNGIPIFERKLVKDSHLRNWRELGLQMIALSVTHYDASRNREIYVPYRDRYICLSKLINDLHGFGFAVRLAVVLVSGYIDSPQELDRMIAFAHDNGVEQLTVRPVNRPDVSANDEVSNWVGENFLTAEKKQALHEHLDHVGKRVDQLPWGGLVYDVNGQNVCITNSLTNRTDDPDLARQLIFFPDNKVSYSWEMEAVPLPATATKHFRVSQWRPMKAVYSFVFPESWAVINRIARKLPIQLFRVETTAARAASLLKARLGIELDVPSTPGGKVDLDEIHVPIIERIVRAYSRQVPDLQQFGWRYPTSGSSEGLFHLLVSLKLSGVDVIHVFNGEYEGYGAQGGNLQLSHERHELQEAAAESGMTVRHILPGDALNLPPGSVWFISNPSARQGNIVPNEIVNRLCQNGQRVILDLSYVGATRAHVFDVSHPNIIAVALSFSKPYGVFRFRMGGFIFTRQEVRTLYGNKWFKDVERLLQALALAEEVTPAGLYPKYRPVQLAIIAALNARFGLGLLPSDAVMLAYLPKDRASHLDVKQLRMIEPFLRGDHYRFCLTPYLEAALRQGLLKD